MVTHGTKIIVEINPRDSDTRDRNENTHKEEQQVSGSVY